MEQSRDDFVIAIRSAFLKKGTQQRFSLLGLIFFSLIFLTNSTKVCEVISDIIQQPLVQQKNLHFHQVNFLKFDP